MKTKYLIPVLMSSLLLGCASYIKSDTNNHQLSNDLNISSDLVALAQQGNSYAQYKLGQQYHFGDGVAENDELALYWFKQSAEQGDVRGMTALANLYEIHKVYKSQALYLYREAAEKGYPKAQRILGSKYLNGFGVPKDLNKSIEWYKKAAEQGDPVALLDLGYIYEKGVGVQKDNKKAFDYYHTAGAVVGDPRAQMHLGGVYAAGELVPKNEFMATLWIGKSAEQGDFAAQHIMAERYLEGRGVLRDYKLAYAWFAVSSASVAEDSESAKWNLNRAASHLSPEELSEAQLLASSFIEKYQCHPVVRCKWGVPER